MSEEKLTCEGCGGKCCAYAAVEFHAPKSLQDFEELVYYLYHENVKVSAASSDDGDRRWYLEFPARCRYLDADGRCLIYEHRPQVCRDHEIESCEHHAPESFQEIRSVSDLLDFMREIGRGRLARKLEAKLPAALREVVLSA